VYGSADARVRSIIEAAAAANPEAGHAIRTSGELTDVLGAADILVCDISAASTEWLPTLRPLVVTDVAASWATIASTPLLDLAPRLTARNVGQVAELVRREVRDDPCRSERERLVEYYLG